VSYVELHTASAFSFLQGASLPEAIVDRAAELGYHSIALLDRDGVYGIPRFHKAACAAGIRPLVGAELTITFDSQERAGPAAAKNAPFVLPRLCESAEGYRNLCRLITRMKLASPKGEGALPLEAFDGMTGRLVAIVGRTGLDAHKFGVGGLLDRIVGLFGRQRTFVELQRHYRRDEESDNQALVSMAEAFASRSSRPTARGSPRRPNVRCSTCSPAFTTTPISRGQAGGCSERRALHQVARADDRTV
jgi:error-prone DNA polymerase